MVSVLYILIAVVLTIWLAGTLYRNGIDLLRERSGQHTVLAQATSRLLVIGFALFTLGYAFLLLQISDEMDGVTALQFLIQRLGILLVSLGLIHLFNTLVFLRFRRSRYDDDAPRDRPRPSRRRPQGPRDDYRPTRLPPPDERPPSEQSPSKS